MKQIIVNCNGDIDNNASAIIFNSLGQKIQTNHIYGTKSIIQTKLNAGVYLVVVNNGGKKVNQKIIIN